MEVDESTLSDPFAPIRMKFGCRISAKVMPSILLCVNGQGFKVRIEIEDKDKDEKSASPPSPPPKRPRRDGDDSSKEEKDPDDWDGHRGGHGSREKEKSAQPPKGGGDGQGQKNKESTQKTVTPMPKQTKTKATSAPPIYQYGSFLANSDQTVQIMASPTLLVQPSVTTATVSADHPQASPSVTIGSIPFAPSTQSPPKTQLDTAIGETDASASRDRERRSKANTDRAARRLMLEDLPPQPDFMDESDQGTRQEEGVIPALSAPVVRAPRSKAVPVATRRSARGEGSSETPILEWAIQRTKAKNSPGTLSLANFSALDPLSDLHLLSVARDSCVIFDSAMGTPAETLSLIRATERAQAELALARAKAEAEKQAALANPAEATTAEGAGPSGDAPAPSVTTDAQEGSRPSSAIAVPCSDQMLPSGPLAMTGVKQVDAVHQPRQEGNLPPSSRHTHGSYTGPIMRQRKKKVLDSAARKPYTRQARAKSTVSQ